MTLEEANVILKYHLPCVITGASDNLKPIANGEYRINQISKSYRQRDRRYIYSAQIEQNQRTAYIVELDDISCASGYETMVESKIKQSEKSQLMRQISKLLGILKTKKEINKYISDLINEIKQQDKIKEQKKCVQD